MRVNSIEFEKAKERAIQYIALSKKTKSEVYNKLNNLKYDTSIISDVIEYLESINYLNDLDYVLTYLRECNKFLKYSVFEIKYKLKNKGIDKNIIDSCIEDFDVVEYENKVKEKIRLKYLDKDKLKNYLYRRGFFE
ncbi:MAG: regulatory protein RecX [Clostridia bacterium]